MGKNWTLEQQRVIELHGNNILVSAAAGSGKTAVLVERIIRMITSETNPVDIDHLVVVTFTNAAAAEMRERIAAALEEYLELYPDDRRVHRQLTLIHTAQITTIDSFCLNILRSNYMKLDIDPGFRVADRGELELLKSDVMEELMEECYMQKNPDFISLVDGYSDRRGDAAIEDMIMELYTFSRSYAWPDEWLATCADMGNISNVNELNQSPAVIYIYNHVMQILSNSRLRFIKLIEICEQEGGPSMYKENVQDDLSHIEDMLECSTFSQWQKIASNVSFTALSRKKGKDVDEELKEYVKNIRTRYRDMFRKLRDKLCAQPLNECIADMKNSSAPIAMLVELARRYGQKLDATKREKNLIDFNDMEQMARKLLVNKTDGVITYTQLADELADYYEEILIDEYQDSNMLQEQILTAISRQRRSSQANNIFMVGDVKQSIYKFRLARPDIFINKYNSYPQLKDCELIELRKNFRSRDTVLDAVNRVFFEIMQKDCGGIEYTEDVKLNAGLKFDAPKPEVRGNAGGTAQIHIASLHNMPKEDDRDIREYEAAVIADIINELTEGDNRQLIFDSDTGTYRNAQYGDIVILTRSVEGWADTFANELMNQGIPARAETSSGYYNTYEIEQILNVLSIIDNPVQDIPLTAVITSYFGTLSLEELSIVRAEYSRGPLYGALTHFIQSREQTADEHTAYIAAKVMEFMEWLKSLRDKSSYMPIQSLIWQLIYDTGYYDYVGGMPAGTARRKNLDRLCGLAKNYAATSYHGLFNFIRYIDKVKKYDLDNSSVASSGESEQVRIMSIHKSKGLEFPVVIIAGMAKEFNNSDARGRVIIDADLGIGVDVIDTQLRTRVTTPVKSAIETKLVTDNLAEELRVLYVAMTRARERLIMVGTVKNMERSQKNWSAVDTFMYSDLQASRSYLDLVMPVAMRNEDVLEVIIHDACSTAYSLSGDNYMPAEDSEDAVMPLDAEPVPAYPYEFASAVKGNMSVSDIKRMEWEEHSEVPVETEYEPSVKPKQDEPPTIPEFISRNDEITPAERGTAFHRIMECLDYGSISTVKDVEADMKRQLAKGLITLRQYEAVDISKVYAFCQGQLGQRVKAAFEAGKLWREQPFVISVPADTIGCYAVTDEKNTELRKMLHGENILIQGVIDLYFEENGEIVLADYKTDKVRRADGFKQLTEHYAVQLDYYAQALSRMTGKNVKEKIIYSFTLDGEVRVE